MSAGSATALRPLGRTGLSIPPLVFGGNVFGWTADKATSFALLDRLDAAGYGAIDTADSYSTWVPGNVGGESEAILGEWMQSRGARSRTTVITKVGSQMPGGKGLSADWIAREVEDSLRRLRTDAIDVYLAHWPDPAVPHEETLRAFERLRADGKVRAFGCSNYDATLLQSSFDAADGAGLPRYAVLQPEYNLADRAAFEGPLQALALREGLGVITYFSLAKGFLSGRYRRVEDVAGKARAGGLTSYFDARGLRLLDALHAVATRHAAQPAEVALAWLMTRPGVTAPIASATSIEQLDSLLRSADLRLSAEDIAELDRA